MPAPIGRPHDVPAWLLYGLAALALVLLPMVGIQMLRQQRAAWTWVAHTHQVLLQSADLELHLQAAIGAARDIGLSEEPDGLASLGTAAQRVAADLIALQALTIDNPRQQRQLARLAPLIDARLEDSRRLAAIATGDLLAGQRAMGALSRANDRSRPITAGIATLVAEETRLLADRQAQLERDYRLTALGLAGGGGVLSASLFGVLAVSRRRGRNRLVALERHAYRQAAALQEAARQAEAAARERALFNTCRDLLFTVSVTHAAGQPAFLFEAVSPACVDITGLPPAAFVGRRPEDCFAPDLAAALSANFLACLLAGRTRPFDLRRGAGHDGAEDGHDYEGSTTPIRQPGSAQIIQLAGCIRDATARNSVQDATYQDRKMQAVGRLAAGLAHDFNNLLQSLSGSLEVLAEEVARSTPAHDVLAAGLRSARRGAHLTDQLLAYSCEHTLRPRDLPLPAVLADLELTLARVLGPLVTITVRCDPAVPNVRADAGQLEAALRNLAINAAQAMPRGGTFTIAASPAVEAGRHWVRILVSDTGIGMDAATLARAIEPFFTTRGLDGTGLGLSMVHNFAVQSGGAVHLRSTPGVGTTVELLLPPAIGAAPAAAPAVAAPAPAGAAQSGYVVAVDDNPDVLLTVAAFLEKAGYQVRRAVGAAEALLILQDGAPVHAMVTDYSMPGMNGVELITAARARRPELPAVIVSGFATMVEYTPDDENTVLLSKPFDRAALTTAVNRLVEAARRRHETVGASIG